MTATDTNVVRFIELPRLRGRVGHTSLSGHDHTVPSWVGVVPQAAASSRSKITELLDHLVGLGEQRGRHGEAERIRGLAIYDQLELGGLLHREVSGLGALQDFVDEGGCAPDEDSTVRTV